MATPVPLEELTALARAIALDASLDVQVGADGAGWFIHPETGIIHADGGDLKREPADDIRGLICHEAAHAAVTRYLALVPETTLRQPGIASLMNSLEDCRIEDWIMTRFPGAAAWVDLYNTRLFPSSAKGMAEQPLFQQFCLGAIHEWWHGVLPARLDPRVIEALEQTRDARARIVQAQPPATADIALSESLQYARHPVANVFRGADRFLPPDAFERLVRMSAYEAWRITWNEVRPVYQRLVDLDKAQMSSFKRAEQRFLTQLRELRFGAPPRPGRGRVVRIPPGLLPPGLEAALAEHLGPPTSMPEEAQQVGALDEDLRKSLEQALSRAPEDRYREARDRVAPLADDMVDRLERLLQPTSFPRWVTGYSSGSRVDLRVAMRLDVEAGAYAHMWQRKTLPTKRDPAFEILLDLSGSMQGEHIRMGFQGVVLCCEVLARLQVPFAVHGFQDVVVPFKDFTDPLDPDMRQTIGTMPLEVSSSRPGGRNHPQHNWDGPCLTRAAELLRDFPAQERFLVVVSDGAPSGPRDGSGELHRSVRRILAAGDIHLVGVGLGPDTDHVKTFYPDAIANISLEEFPAALGQLLDRLILSRPGSAAVTRHGARA